MQLTGLHLLLTYQCTLECDHCFVWGSPQQSGVMSLTDIRLILDQASQMDSLRSIYFEGGEPFLYYATLLRAVQEVAERGYQTGIVTNAYWATSEEDAFEALKPFAGLVQDLSVSSDLFHWSQPLSQQAQNAAWAAERLAIPCGVLSIAQPAVEAASAQGQLPLGEDKVMYRGRAAIKLAGRAPHHPWEQFTECPYENLRDPGRLHLDPLGYVHICQGISLGNIHQTSLAEICANYDPDEHLITVPLLHGGPAELVRLYDLPHADAYADACQLCYESRRQLRSRFTELLAPDPMYGL
jgi:MoaA/NifB/PqqE/SkfB family radical SAM enzyme